MDNFTCTICLGNVVDARMCPGCSKLFCCRCINRWLSESVHSKKCPACKRRLEMSQMLVLRWAGDVACHLRERTIALDCRDTLCSSHNSEKVDVFCVHCKASMCHRCALFEHHATHSFARLEEIYLCRREGLQLSMERLRQGCVQLAEQVQKELNAFNYVRICLDRKASIDTCKLRDMQLFELRQELESKQLVLDECELVLARSSKSALVEMSDKLINMCKG